jgi:adenosine deaminase
MAETHHLDMRSVVEAVCDGVQSASEEIGMRVNLIGIISRTYGVDSAWKELDALLSQRDHLIAIDLAGDEANQPGELFVDHFKRIKDEGLFSIAHAGESNGPSSIWQAIRELGAVRIGHAVRAIDDMNLLDYLAENQIAIESNLTSNVQTSTVEDYASHPIKIFVKHGILTNLNTDDPGISGIDLHHEYNVAAHAAGLTREQIRQLQKNALEMAFLHQDEKEQLLLCHRSG